MATSPSANPTPVTPPRVPLIDQRTGLIDRAWYQFFLSLFRTANSTVNDDSALGPDVQDLSGDFSNLYSQAQLASMMERYEDCCRALEQRLDTEPSDQTQELQARVASVEQELQTLPPKESLDELVKRVEALECLPPPPQVRLPRYGTFYDTTTKTAAAINTAYPITFNTTDLSFGVYRGVTTSQIYVDTPGVYDFQFSAQLDNTSGGNHIIYIWCRINGVDVAQSASQVRLKGNDGELVAAWNFVLSMNAGDYFELVWSVTDTGVQILAVAAAAPVPAIPSVILTVTNNIKG